MSNLSRGPHAIFVPRAQREPWQPPLSRDGTLSWGLECSQEGLSLHRNNAGFVVLAPMK